MPIPVQPVGYHHYFSPKLITTPSNLGHFFYSSWEDALWDLLRTLKLEGKSKILVPSFFCSDVLKNLKNHLDVEIITYSLDQDFQISPQLFKKHIKLHKPQIVIILHAAGITNQLFNNSEIWLSSLPPETLLIEDSVHRLVDPKKINLLTKRHVVIDSLRKVSPVPGSNLYAHPDLLNFKPPAWWKTIPYQLFVYFYWFLFQLFLFLGQFPVLILFRKALFQKAEKFMLLGYNKIGDSDVAAPGWPLWQFLSKHLDLNKISGAKKDQVAIYRQKLEFFFKSKDFFNINIPKSDYGELRGHPLGLALTGSTEFLQKVRQKGLLLRFELNDSLWSSKQKVVYLPLGPHLTRQDIHKTCDILIECY